MRDAEAPGLPLLGLVAAHPAGRARARRTRRASTSTGASPRACASAASRRWRPSTTGTCRRRCRTRAAGRRATSSSASPSTRALVLDGLDDVVDDWMTHNEPWVTSFLGYAYGTKAPGLHDWPPRSALRTTRCSRTASSCASSARRAARGRIGITLDLTVANAGERRRRRTAAALRLDGHHNRWFLDAVLRGGYPADMVELLRAARRPARRRPRRRPRD